MQNDNQDYQATCAAGFLLLYALIWLECSLFSMSVQDSASRNCEFHSAAERSVLVRVTASQGIERQVCITVRGRQSVQFWSYYSHYSTVNLLLFWLSYLIYLLFAKKSWFAGEYSLRKSASKLSRGGPEAGNHDLDGLQAGKHQSDVQAGYHASDWQQSLSGVIVSFLKAILRKF